LNQYIKGRLEIKKKHDKPSRIVSLTVDHDLQESSSAMAQHAATLAESLGVEQITTKLPWGQENYPPKPGPDEKMEEIARDMRQRIFFGHMKSLNVNSLALGHHADDQVETMLMRLGRGSTQFGLSGMRPCRRWGMGSGKPEDDEAYGIHGLRKWIVRPLLGVGKVSYGFFYICRMTNLRLF
jgi:tRNA(Ile)-lysidine synthase